MTITSPQYTVITRLLGVAAFICAISYDHLPPQSKSMAFAAMVAMGGASLAILMWPRLTAEKEPEQTDDAMESVANQNVALEPIAPAPTGSTEQSANVARIEALHITHHLDDVYKVENSGIASRPFWAAYVPVSSVNLYNDIWAASEETVRREMEREKRQEAIETALYIMQKLQDDCTVSISSTHTVTVHKHGAKDILTNESNLRVGEELIGTGTDEDNKQPDWVN